MKEMMDKVKDWVVKNPVVAAAAIIVVLLVIGLLVGGSGEGPQTWAH
jgi:uncharacterized membrane protein YdfJ with MMPL/SSD domain